MNQKRPPQPLRERCPACPFSKVLLQRLRDADYWQCIECHYRDRRLNELLEAEVIRATRIIIKYRRLPDADAEEVAQDYGMKLVRERHKWTGEPLQPWFATILTTTIIDRQRRNGSNKLMAVEFHSPDEESPDGLPEPTAASTAAIDGLIREEQRCKIEAALASIKNEKYRAILALMLEGFANVEIQEVLSVVPQDIWNAMGRGIPIIRRQLGLDQIE